jgi:hypothetical protein
MTPIAYLVKINRLSAQAKQMTAGLLEKAAEAERVLKEIDELNSQLLGVLNEMAALRIDADTEQ